VTEADPFAQALELAGALHRTAAALEDGEQSATLDRLRGQLSGGHTRLALLLLHNLHTDYTVALAEELMPAALSARDVLLVRQIFARLPRHEAAGVVPHAVAAQLAKTPDEDAYRRLAGLLDYLGLDDALRELAEAALTSDDPDVREVGEEYRPD
jgi:hypothetical protein